MAHARAIDIFTLDEQFRRKEICDVYESFIWTERYNAWGDFELQLRSNRANRTRFHPGAWIAIERSKRVMQVETIEDSVDEDGAPTLLVQGRSMEALLEGRPGMFSLDSLANSERWDITATPANTLRIMFDHICVTKALSPDDGIPFYTPGTLTTAGTLAEPSQNITVNLEPNSLYKHMHDIARLYNIGFRLVRNGDNSQVFFEVYMGDDKTTNQTQFRPVIFSPSLDNLTDHKELSSISAMKNVALVYAKNGWAYVYPVGVPPTVSGADRRVLVVKVDGLEDVLPENLGAVLEQKGQEALAQHRAMVGFDGEIPRGHEDGMYDYGCCYNLGDLVEKRNSDGLSAHMLVTEHIFASDREGVRSYPTLSTEGIVTPGTWQAQPVDLYWSNADSYWADA